jgi:hypothetical protein
MANKTWLWQEKRFLWLIKISTFLTRFLLEIPNLRKCGKQKFWHYKSPVNPLELTQQEIGNFATQFIHQQWCFTKYLRGMAYWIDTVSDS